MKKTFWFAVLIVFITNSCDKSEHYPSDISEFTSNKIETSDNVKRVDEDWKLLSSNYELSNGTYRYSYSGDQPEIEVGTVIVDTINGGYIRKVDEVISNKNGVLKLGTSQATFSDLFEEGTLEFVIGLDENLKSTSEKDNIKYEDVDKDLDPGFETDDGTEYEINAEISDAVSIEGSMTFKPRIYFKWEFSKENGLENMDFFLDNTQIILDATFNVSNNQSISASVQKSFGKLSKRGWFWVSGIPVVFDIEVEFIGYGIIEIEEKTNFPVSYTNTSTLSFGVEYCEGETNFVNAFTNKSEINASPTIEANAQIQVNVVPQINIKFYEVLGTVIKPKPYLDITANYINVSGESETCAQVDAGIDLGLSLRGEILDEELFDLSKDFEGARKTLWKSDDDCILPEISISDPEWAIGTHTCSGTTPYTVTFQVEDPAGLIDEATSLYAMHMFHYNTGETKKGNITRSWEDMEFTPGQLSYNICIGWVDATYVEQSFYITTADGTKSNMVTVIIPRGSN